MNKLILYLKNDDHEKIVESIFKAAKFPSESYKLIVSTGRHKLSDISKDLPLTIGTKIGILINLDVVSIPDAKEYSKKKITNNPAIEVFYGVPEVESWVFADDELVRRNAKPHSKLLLERLPLPEEILHPKQTAYNIFRSSNWEFLTNMNLSKASARSPSLFDFLSRVSYILNVELKALTNPISKNVDRRLFVNLLKEINNGDTIMFKSAAGDIYTAKEMIRNIVDETDIGVEYTNSMLRTVRDFLSRKAKRKE